MTLHNPLKSTGGAVDCGLVTRFASTDAEIEEVQKLRFDVFVTELGAQSDHAEKELDEFDQGASHLLLIDPGRPSGHQIVGTYRLIEDQHFSSALEYDLSALVSSGRKLLELSRSCVHRDYRDGRGMFLLWQALSRYIQDSRIEVLFGVASFHGQDTQKHAEALSYLSHHHLADSKLRPVSLTAAPFDLLPSGQIDKKAALRGLPSLIKAYLRLGGQVGHGAYVDRKFNTIDVCMVLDMKKLNLRQAALYQGQAG